MKRIPQTCEFYLYDVPDHAELKEKILRGISDMGSHSLVEGQEKISNTDWHLGSGYDRPYFNHLIPLFNAHLTNVMDLSGVPKHTPLTLNNYWFQQYAEGDYHKWHIHQNSMFSNVYYVDLPEGASKTSFSFAGESFEVDVKEGQILTFPGCFLHCSKPNPVGVKTIISFNY
jgi:hypothetical protein